MDKHRMAVRDMYEKFYQIVQEASMAVSLLALLISIIALVAK